MLLTDEVALNGFVVISPTDAQYNTRRLLFTPDLQHDMQSMQSMMDLINVCSEEMLTFSVLKPSFRIVAAPSLDS